MNARNIMTKEPVCCTPETNLQEVAQMMVDHDCGEIPVVENESSARLIGVITDRDIVCRSIAKSRNPLEMTAEECMTSSPASVEEGADLEECRQKMEEHQVRRIPVVDRNGNCVGIISQADIVRQDAEEGGETVREVSEPRKRKTA